MLYATSLIFFFHYWQSCCRQLWILLYNEQLLWQVRATKCPHLANCSVLFFFCGKEHEMGLLLAGEAGSRSTAGSHICE
jgi:hypothetical protein